MKIATWIFAVLFFSVLSINGAEITNFRAGEVCSDGIKLLGVCRVTEDIYVTGQSVCVFNGERRPCTWYGFSFDYVNAKPGTEIICKFSSSLNIANGNPQEIISERTRKGDYQIVLDKEKGHFFNPQYFLFGGYVNRASSLNETETVCSINGKQ